MNHFNCQSYYQDKIINISELANLFTFTKVLQIINFIKDKFNLQIDVIVQNILDKINIALKQNQKPNTLSNTEEYFINNISNTYDYNEIEILFLDILFNDGASEYF